MSTVQIVWHLLWVPWLVLLLRGVFRIGYHFKFLELQKWERTSLKYTFSAWSVAKLCSKLLCLFESAGVRLHGRSCSAMAGQECLVCASTSCTRTPGENASKFKAFQVSFQFYFRASASSLLNCRNVGNDLFLTIDMHISDSPVGLYVTEDWIEENCAEGGHVLPQMRRDSGRSDQRSWW